MASACDATASVVPALIQIYMRLGFAQMSKQTIKAYHNKMAVEDNEDSSAGATVRPSVLSPRASRAILHSQHPADCVLPILVS